MPYLSSPLTCSCIYAVPRLILLADLAKQGCTLPHICVGNTNSLWLLLQFQFHERIAQLTYTFPEDATTSTGSLFWSAPKRFPRPLTFDPADPSHIAFAQAGAILKAQVHNIEIPSWAADFSKVTMMCHHAGLLDFAGHTHTRSRVWHTNGIY